MEYLRHSFIFDYPPLFSLLFFFTIALLFSAFHFDLPFPYFFASLL